MIIKILITIVITAIIAGGVGYWLGKISPAAIAQLEDFTTRLETMNREGEAHLVEKFELTIPMLLDLENGQIQNTKDRLVEEFGHFYYNYTYEDERDMNSKTIEGYLKQFESLAQEHASFRRVIEFVPND